MGFRDRIAAYNAQKETKVNPPEAAKVLETKSEPEVANVKAEARPVESAAAPEPSQPSAESPAVSSSAPAAEPGDTTEAPKAKRGRPAGSKNSPKPPTAATSTEATSPLQAAADVDQVLASFTVEQLCQELSSRGYMVQLTHR